VRLTRLWARLLGVVKAVVEGVEFDEDDECIVVAVHPRKATKRRCGECGKRSPGYDRGEGRRRWRALDLGTIKAFLEADSPRVRCRDHGVVVAQVPWARHGAGHTYAFDDTCSWLVTHCSKSAVRQLLRVAWRTVGSPIHSRARAQEARSHTRSPCWRIHVQHGDLGRHPPAEPFFIFLVSRGSRNGSLSGGCPASTCRARSSSALNSAPSRTAMFEIHSHTRKMMTPPRAP
jgi:hypothetical protein